MGWASMIPNKIHFIWIGSPLPQKYRDTVQRFGEHNHQNYNIFLWTDLPTAPIKHIQFRPIESITLINDDLYRQETNFGAKADILRYEIIYNEGGIYNDIDIISLNPLDPTVFNKEFVSHTFQPWNNLTNAVFGFPPHHPFIRYLLDRLPHSDGIVSVRTGPEFFTRCFLDFYKGGHLTWKDFCKMPLEVQRIHQDQLVFPRKSIETDRHVGYTYHLNDANWTNKPRAPVKSKLSLCTAIKNRLCHLSRTLPQNIADAPPWTEFVILDYSSDDGLGDWLKPFVSNGLVNYYRIEGQMFWKNSHAKNMSTLVAQSEIICNLDADNYIGVGFPGYVVSSLERYGGVLTAPPAVEGVTGRVAIHKQDFIAVGGYNEDLCYGWGCEDIDLVIRANMLGYSVNYIDLKYLHQIQHGDDLRARHGQIDNIGLSNRKSLAIMTDSLRERRYVANAGRPWGQGPILKNYQTG
jgi:hypothetical protein